MKNANTIPITYKASNFFSSVFWVIGILIIIENNSLKKSGATTMKIPTKENMITESLLILL